MLKVLGRANSSNVQKVVWALHELGVPYERTDVGGAFGGTKTPEYLEMNPNSVVPTIIDDGFVLWESNVCVRYLAEKHAPGTLLPSDLRARFDCERWMDWQQTVTLGAITPIFWGLIRTPEAERDHAAIDAAKERMKFVVDVMNKRLTGRAFFMGDDFTAADIPLGIVARRWFELVDDRPSVPAMEAWFERLKAREAFRVACLDVPLT
jgi:glutathione S-transferase